MTKLETIQDHTVLFTAIKFDLGLNSMALRSGIDKAIAAAGKRFTFNIAQELFLRSKYTTS